MNFTRDTKFNVAVSTHVCVCNNDCSFYPVEQIGPDGGKCLLFNRNLELASVVGMGDDLQWMRCNVCIERFGRSK